MIKDLEEAIGYRFHNITLLQNANTELINRVLELENKLNKLTKQ